MNYNFSFLKTSINRETDKCEYCERGKTLKQKIAEIIRDENYEIQEAYKLEDLINYFTRKAVDLSNLLSQANEEASKEQIEVDYEKYKVIVHILKEYDVILFHKNVAHCQRESYKNQHTNVDHLKDKILIEVDFKQHES